MYLRPEDYQFHSQPFDHQRELFVRTADAVSWGTLWEQGCGKTKPTIDKAAYLFENDKIDCLLVVAPNGVHLNWIKDELPAHFPERLKHRCAVFAWETAKRETKWHQRQAESIARFDGLAIVTISYDAFVTEKGKDFVWKLLRRRRCFYVLDESDNIKTPSAKRTYSITRSGHWGAYRAILTGTPVTQGPFDIYSQIRFLDYDFWKNEGIGSTFTEFRAFFGVWRFDPVKFEAARQRNDPLADFNPLREYRNLDILQQLLAKVCDRLTKEGAGLKLPPKLYSKRYFEMNKEQRRVYDDLRANLEAELDSGEIVDGSMAVTRLLRLQQISCGYAIHDSDEPEVLLGKDNPRLDSCVEYCESLGHQAIIWARFRKDVDLIVDALGPGRAVRYDGKISDDECERSKRTFKAGGAQFIVATEKMQAGHTYNEAKTVYFYSNSFKLKTRLQEEDRAHRIGQDGIVHEGLGHGVHYVDSCGVDTVDDKIIGALRNKFDIASQITGDKLKEWI